MAGTNNMKLYAIISMIIVFAILAWIVGINLAHADCIGAEVGGGCVGIPVPSDRPYRYDDHDRDRDRSGTLEHHHHRYENKTLHDDELEE
jgi:hypothetical protein